MAKITNAMIFEFMQKMDARITAIESQDTPTVTEPEPEPGTNEAYLRDQNKAKEQAAHMLAKCQSWCGGGALTGDETRTFYAVPASKSPSGVAFRWYAKVPRNAVKVAEINSEGNVARFYKEAVHFGLAA